MSSSSSSRRTPVPLLLDSFPLPPSHIPVTPQSATFINPPPSKPPSSPLPPVPGPSRISEADTLQLLLQSSRGHSSKSHRSSRYSEANRDSVISTTSSNGGAASGYVMPRSSGSTRPTERPLSPRGRPSLSSSIDEHRLAPPPPAPMLMRDVVSPMLPIFDDDDDDDDDAAGAVTTSPRRRRKRHQANESISSIDVRDILGAASGGEEEAGEVDLSPSKPLPSEKIPNAASAPIGASHSHKSSLAYLKFDTEDEDHSTSQSIPSHSLVSSSMEPSFDHFASASTTTLRSSSTNISSSSSTNPILYQEKQAGKTETISKDGPRAPSPDIDTIIQSTPKPTKRSFSMGSGASKSRATSLRSVKSMKNVRDEGVDEFGALPGAIRLSRTTMGKKALASDDLDYVVQGSWTNRVEDDEEKFKALERELEGGDSDSDLDLHTPLPHLMVRDGLLSSNSKLFADSRANTPLISSGGRPGSSMSTVTKSGVIKDERDTPMRRVRHRDGRLLRGGIGLTTGLGWSDSEDEDAPSPLTRRLSTLDLSRRSSASSFFSTTSRAPHPLSRSYSSGALYEDSGFSLGGPPMESDEDLLKDMGGWSDRRAPSSNPPTAWPKKRSMPSPSARSSIASSNGRQSISSSAGRLSVGSTGSNFSMEVTSPTEDSLLRTPSRPRGSVSSGESIHNRRSGDSSIYSRSTASTVSIPLPVTPQNEARVPNHVTSSTPHVNKNKSLPPLPGVLKKTASKASLKGSQLAFPRVRTTSSSSTKAPISSAPATPVRPLRLPGQVRAAARGDRPAVPVPSLSSSRSSQSQGDPVTSPTSPTSPTPTRPRPRIGNGMVYKRSVSASTKVRPPMPLHSNSMSTSSIGRPSGLPRAL